MAAVEVWVATAAHRVATVVRRAAVALVVTLAVATAMALPMVTPAHKVKVVALVIAEEGSLDISPVGEPWKPILI